MQRVALLNGANINQDYDLMKIFKSLAHPGIVEGLQVQNGKVTGGYGFFNVVRGGETFPVLFQNTADEVIDTTGTKKVFIEVTQANIDDGSSNNSNGSGIGSIKTAINYPASNFVKLASITSGVILDEREKIGLAVRNLSGDYALLDIRNINIFRTINSSGNLGKIEASDFLLNGVGIGQALGLVPLDINGKIDSNFIPSTGNTVQYIASANISKGDKINGDVQNSGRAIFLGENIQVSKTTGSIILGIAKSDYVIGDVVEVMTDLEWADFLTGDISNGDLITNPGDIIILNTNQVYNYNNINISNGSIITTNSTTGFIFIKAKGNIVIEGDIILSGKINTFETNILGIGNTSISPGNAGAGGNGGNGGNGGYHSSYGSAGTRGVLGNGLNGYGGGGGGGAHGSGQNGTIRTSGNGGSGGSPAGLGGTNSTNSNGGNSSGGAGLWKFNTGGYAGGNAYSNNGAYGSGSGSGGGGGAGGEAGKSGVCLVIIHENPITGVGTIESNGGNGSNGGNAGNGWSYGGGSGTNVGYSSGGGGGGGGGSGGGGGGGNILLIGPTTNLPVTTILNGGNAGISGNGGSGGIPNNFNGQVGGSAGSTGGAGGIGGNGVITYKTLGEFLNLYKPTY